MSTVTIKNRTMYYEEYGSGFPIIFGHSYLWDNAMWQPQIAALSTTYRCIVPDLWSHGCSDPPPSNPYSVEELAEDMWTFAQALGLEQFAVVGLSVGGMWGAHLALDHPEAVSALVLLDTYLGSEPAETHVRYFGMLRIVEKTGIIPTPLQDEIVPLFFSPITIQQDPDMVSHFKANLSSFDAAQISGIVGMGQGIFSRTSQLERLHQITAPTMIIVGADDKSRPPHEAQKMAENIPGATLEVIPDAGHISNLEQPKQVTQLLEQFLNNTVGKNKNYEGIYMSHNTDKTSKRFTDQSGDWSEERATAEALRQKFLPAFSIWSAKNRAAPASDHTLDEDDLCEGLDPAPTFAPARSQFMWVTESYTL
ncbi:MAG: alpha/beta fold hydrolase [Anaerolineae bacterium]|nr:alpha/beta fold hydrolase [Anaerolineae bacterium]